MLYVVVAVVVSLIPEDAHHFCSLAIVFDSILKKSKTFCLDVTDLLNKFIFNLDHFSLHVDLHAFLV